MNPNVASFEVKTDVVVSGTTSTPTQIKLKLVRNEIGGRKMRQRLPVFRVKVANTGTFADATNATIAAGSDATTVTTVTSTKELILAEVEGAYATQTLTVSGVVIDGQTVTIGSRVYQFRTGATALTSGNVAVNISARGTKAAGILTIAEPLTAGDTVVIGDQTYIFVTGTANAAGEIGIGADEAATKVNIPAAINGTDSINTANTKVTASAFSADVCTLTARYTGTQGNSIVTAELGQGLTHASNVFNAATLGTTTAGVDPTAAHAITDLVAVITGDASAVVSAVDSTGDTMVVTSPVKGTAGQYASTETMTNGAWGAATLAGGVDEADGSLTVVLTDATAESFDLLVSGDVPFGGYPVAPRRIAVTHAAP